MMTLQELSREADLEKVRQVLETRIVRERLEALGFGQDEIQERLDALNDEQLHQLAVQIDDLKVGGDALGIIIALLVIAILVVLFIKLTEHKIIITK